MVRYSEDPVFSLRRSHRGHTENGRQIGAFYRLLKRTNNNCQELLYWATVAVLGSRCRSPSAPTAASRDLELRGIVLLEFVDNSRQNWLLVMVFGLQPNFTLIAKRNLNFRHKTCVHNLLHCNHN